MKRFSRVDDARASPPLVLGTLDLAIGALFRRRLVRTQNR
jgi:hypothetical protein